MRRFGRGQAAWKPDVTASEAPSLRSFCLSQRLLFIIWAESFSNDSRCSRCGSSVRQAPLFAQVNVRPSPISLGAGARPHRPFVQEEELVMKYGSAAHPWKKKP